MKTKDNTTPQTEQVETDAGEVKAEKRENTKLIRGKHRWIN